MKTIYQIFFSNNSKLSKIQAIIDDVAKTDIAVLIKGESGTGKELIARAIHLNSPRRERVFIKVNCAAIPSGLLESELFGFEKGAFTGADLKKPGKFELAHGGTILLNEIEEMDISTQGKLLQVLQEGEFSPLGGSGTVSVDARVITTTQDHLERSMMKGLFREDLFYRINAITLTVPPLRDRREQIIPLSQYFFNLYRTKYGKRLPALSFSTLSTFKAYEWPGNIRELENVIKRIVLLGEEQGVVDELIRRKSGNHVSSASPADVTLHSPTESDSLNLRETAKKAAEGAEIELIREVLNETHWNRKVAAGLLKISYKALLNKIQKYHLNHVVDFQNDGGGTGCRAYRIEHH
jgi:two-component system, NtrC family, response regulator AtoC